MKIIKPLIVFILVSGCSNGAPSDQDVKNSLEFMQSDQLAKIGCVDYKNFQRQNGQGNDGLYLVSFSVDRTTIKNKDACLNSIKAEPIELVEPMRTLVGLHYQYAEKDKRIDGVVALSKTEKGWKRISEKLN